MNKDRHFPYLLLAPAVLVLAATMFLPLCCTLSFSLQTIRLDQGGWNATFAGAGNYVSVFRDELFRRALWNTLYFVVAAVPVEMVLGLLLSLLLYREFRTVRLMRTLLLLPVMVSPVVVAVIWRMLFNTDVGLFNYALSCLGFPRQSWLGNPSTAMPALILTDIWHWTPYCMLLTLAGLQSLSPEVYEAARVDGATAWQRLIHITLPLLKPVLVVVLIFRGLEAFIIFDKVYILTGGGPGLTTETLSMYVYRTGFKYFHLGSASAMAFIMFAIILAVSFSLVRNLSRRFA